MRQLNESDTRHPQLSAALEQLLHLARQPLQMTSPGALTECSQAVSGMGLTMKRSTAVWPV
ncbi:MAG: hypothetical protein CSA54_04265 [Gammaproteobacteria bacterium]|nr:MAG: hypothetical protein CSA54_04265 [Gammaproteobacteria bacterium]